MIVVARPGESQVDWSALQFALGAARTAAIRDGVVDTPVLDISSTDIRRRIAEHKSIRYLVPDAVAEYIRSHAVYAPPDGSHRSSK
jgi:nicotinate-nucleotide adenylyltransferase